MTFRDEIAVHLRSRSPVIWVDTFEEERLVEILKRLCEDTKRRLLCWDVAGGFQSVVEAAVPNPRANDPQTALETVGKADGKRELVFLLKDFHRWLDQQPMLTRQLRNLAQDLRCTLKSIVISAPTSRIPEDLKDDIVLLELPPPELAELRVILDRLTRDSKIKVDLTPLGREKLLQAALGLSANQARRVYAKAIVTELGDANGRVLKPAGVLDEHGLEVIANEKKSIIRQSGALEFHAPHETIADVGGLEVLKEWLKNREAAFFSKEAHDYGLRTPKGIALVGIPGTGKSLTAKMIAGLWHLPLIRLDVGALFGGLVGQSEENTRRALRLVETVAPCILWIEEMEQAFAQGGGDGGTSQRVFADVLVWMQEKTKPVFVIGTANDISRLPPQFLRAGRFDATFFLDLPTLSERRDIFTVHIGKQKRLPQQFDIDRLAVEAEGYVGAEIEQAVIDAMYLAYGDPVNRGRDFTTDDISDALKHLTPLSRSQWPIITAMRAWLIAGGAQSASYREKEAWQANAVPSPNNVS